MSVLNEPLWVQIFVGTTFLALVLLVARMVICWPKRLTGKEK